MRDQIKDAAVRLLITHGVRGFRFGDIADELKITRANIHYHFGTKIKLIEEVIKDYLLDTLDRIRGIWTDDDLTYEEKARRMMEFNRARYDLFNPPGVSGRPWSLISRMRLEADQLSPEAKATLKHFTSAVETFIGDAAAQAQARGEIARDAPLKDVAIQLIAIVDSSGSITQDAGSFERLEHLYTAYIRIIHHAYGGDGVGARRDVGKRRAGRRPARSA
ncbi:TetR/AcrR family transcriptional regulator [Marinivivus vitaminiproducens]|uniref:TetR/AcrR family transcriptional regulator n=1 Tax=Marinivivus vitaminiproducens TaxID=3035935 RepID=UPI0027A30F54|nr:TetR/AcrR family transcriptional regulator [Geminicoccaceae bacterium SCSIO 64248]